MRGARLASLLAIVATSLIVGRSRAARADWEVRRTNDRALVEQAARALTAHPEDAGLAARLVRLAGRGGAAALRARFEAAARAADAHEADVTACATLLFALGAYDDAAAMFARAAASGPSFAVSAGRARALDRAGRRDEALPAYDDAVARATTPGERKRLLEAEVALVPSTDLERELGLRRTLAALEPHADDAAGRVADVLERLGRAAEAADLLEARPADARWFERGLRVAELRDAAGDGARAATVLDGLLARLPRADDERRRLAWTRALAVARHRDALPALAEALARAPGAVEWDVLGQVRDELGDLEGALEAERRAGGTRPGAELGRRIVALLDRLGRDDEAVAVYEALARGAPDDPSWPLELVERELRRGRRAPGEQHFDHAVAHFSRSPSAMVRLAELAARWGEDARARAAWEQVRRLAPRDEQGILGLGEAQFAAGQRALALKTWRALRERAPGAAGRLRLAEVLLDHDLLAEAFSEAQEARTREPKQARVHRVLAQILERQRQTDAAVREWEATLEHATGPEAIVERREARTRILVLLSRARGARLNDRVRELEERVRRAPDDRESALFLAEADERLGNQAGAITTLRAILEHDAAAPPTPTPAGATVRAELDADVTFALVRLLRAAGQSAEALGRLEDLARRVPARAREAHVQIADLELARHEDTVALAHAEQAARLGAGDGQALTRIAAIEERAGDDERAFETYRRAFERDGDATAGFALAALHERRGDVAASADVLRHIVETATDDEVITEAGRRAIDVEELLGRLPDFERLVARGLFSSARAPALRHVLVDVLRRLLPPLYRAPASDAARETRARLAQHALRPLLELVTERDGPPDTAVVELLGLLGNKDAAPVLANLAAPATEPAAGPPGAGAPDVEEPRLAAIIALGRLGDERGHEVLEKVAGASDGKLRAAAVWALGRLADPRDGPLFVRALRDARADVVGFACLGLGRGGGARAAGVLASVATDAARPLPARRAALVGLGLLGERAGAPTLLALARSGDDALTRAALLSLGGGRDRRTLPVVLEAALFGRAPAADAALLALDLWVSGARLPDEARAITGTRVDLEALLGGLEPALTGADASIAWREDPRAVTGAVLEALRDAGPRRLRALAALAARDDGIGLGALVADGAPLPPATAAALAALADATRDAVAALLDADDPAVRAGALAVLAKLGDARVTSSRVARAAAGDPSERDAAVAVARRWTARAPDRATALAGALAAALTGGGEPSATSGTRGRLGLVAALAATGDAGRAALRHAVDDRDALVRAAASAALAAAPRAHDEHP